MLREKLQLTQQEFATLLGLATVSISRWEQNQTRPTDMSRALMLLLDRALKKKPPEAVVGALRGLEDEVQRFITLVHLGD